VLADRLGLFGQRPRTLGDIADEMGISRERVRLLEHTAVRRLQPARGHPSLS
jgi:DNA-directed RNA polymerase sigma subunit (sigma70/sigma32)